MVEDRKERVDRDLVDLLTRTDRDACYAAFLCTEVGTIMSMAPFANHRLRFREYDKELMLCWFNRLVLVGSAILAAAIAMAVVVVTDMLFDQSAAALLAALIAAWVVIAWYVAALRQRHRHSAE